jgi:glyoxylase-like metal-dependent hydrolase (beta-lactamase superfamily II)
LGEETLVASGRRAYYPIVPAPHGLACFNTPYQDFFVNAYLAWDVDTREAVAFDTGSELRPMLDAIRQHDLTLKLILLTHTHPDHILKLAELKQATGAPAYVSHLEPTPGADTHEEGRTFEVGRLRVEARQTTGHSRGGTTYVVRGLDKDLAVVGDALFAGSMGGGIVSYEDALANNRRKVLSLPDDTVICPGHGPLSTIGLEKRHNPFYPELN